KKIPCYRGVLFTLSYREDLPNVVKKTKTPPSSLGKEVPIIIVGPTASGKSALAVSLAKKFNGEVISADSRQIYRGLNLGTGKITKKEMRGIPHHLLDIASPKKNYTAADFVRDGERAIKDIQARGKRVIICGGTGFYIDALMGRVALGGAPPN